MRLIYPETSHCRQTQASHQIMQMGQHFCEKISNGQRLLAIPRCIQVNSGSGT